MNTSHPRSSARRRLRNLTATACAVTGLSAQAGLFSFTANPGLPVPDGNASGLVSVLEVTGPAERILDVDVSLTLAGDDFGGWNGDLYVYLAHEGRLSVLLNRPGVSGSDLFGYGDNGFLDLTFDDEATSGDIHVYQDLQPTPGDPSLPITGAWQPDARGSDPGSVRSTDPRTRFLSSLDGQWAPGEWRLFVADLSPGGAFVLQNWTLNLTTETPGLIPEPATAGPIAALVVMGLTGVRWWLARRDRGATR